MVFSCGFIPGIIFLQIGLACKDFQRTFAEHFLSAAGDISSIGTAIYYGFFKEKPEIKGKKNQTTTQ